MPKEWETRLEQLGREQARLRSDARRKTRPSGAEQARPAAKAGAAHRAVTSRQASSRAERARPSSGLLSPAPAADVRNHSLRPLVILAVGQTVVLLVAVILIARFAGAI